MLLIKYKKVNFLKVSFKFNSFLNVLEKKSRNMITILDLRKSTRKLKINDSENEVLIDDGGDTNEVNSFDSSADEFGNGLNKIRESNTTIERSSSSSTSSSPTLFKQRLAKSSRVRKNNKEYKNNSNSV